MLTPSSRSFASSHFSVRSKCVYPTKKVVNQSLELPQQYSLIEKVGQGSFGEIFKIYDNETQRLAACKVEHKQQKNTQPLLVKEYKVLSTMNDEVQYQLIQNHDCNIILMPYFGSGNLEELRKKQRSGRFSKKTTMLLGITLVDQLEKVHAKQYLHRDIKPENFIVGSAGDQHRVHLIDYGLAKQYVDHHNQHIPMATNKGMVGTARYTSINSHVGLEQSRRDDLEALGYVLLYLFLGGLPWQNYNCQSRQEKFQRILEQKVLGVKYSSNQLNLDTPPELKKFFENVRSLQFDQKPDYNYLKSLFQQGLLNEQKKLKSNSLCYDWCPLNCKLQSFDFDSDVISNEVPKQSSTLKSSFLNENLSSLKKSIKKETTTRMNEIEEIEEEQKIESLILDQKPANAQKVLCMKVNKQSQRFH